MLIETLNSWKHELDNINELADARNMTSNAARYILLVYRGEDNSVAALLERTTTIEQDGMVLYYYLTMHYCAGLNASKVYRLVKQIEDSRMKTLRTSKDGREALARVVDGQDGQRDRSLGRIPQSTHLANVRPRCQCDNIVGFIPEMRGPR